MTKPRFFENAGQIALGSRLRRLTEKITEDATRIYALYGVDLKPKWFPVYYVLSGGVPKAITTLAEEIGHSHPSVSKIIREMVRAGIVTETRDRKDKRKNMVGLSARGEALKAKIADQYRDMQRVLEEMSSRTRMNLWEAIGEWEQLLEEENLFQRVVEEKCKREGASVNIVPYTDRYRAAFRQLNETWITTYFTLEEADRKALNDPVKNILMPGGHILIALYEGKPVGTCALLKMEDPRYDFELVKMAVAPAMRGKNIGYRLGKAIIEKARETGAVRLYLESNTALQPAINLYRKLGFREVTGHASPYARCNIQMELDLHAAPPASAGGANPTAV